ncbi:hypothetical protein K438DRAFT_1868034 [Mycena galopus ATCC 62051]|nr:hypothetical protein K438DRAFT_1868034 [Mycena galopus ATCC 62051]
MSGLIFRMLASSIFTLLLPWGTVSAAMIIEYFTPTIDCSVAREAISCTLLCGYCSLSQVFSPPFLIHGTVHISLKQLYSFGDPENAWQP